MSKSPVYEITVCALFAALMCIFGPMSVPIGLVPISLTNLILYFAVFLLGTRGTLTSYIVYLLLGAVGLPVFSGYAGGIGKLAGPTGGYLIGFIFLVLISGTFYRIFDGNLFLTALGMVLGTAVAYAFGTAWFVYQQKCDFDYALGVCVTPFIPFDLAKIVIASILGKAVRIPLMKAGLLPAKTKEKQRNTNE